MRKICVHSPPLFSRSEQDVLRKAFLANVDDIYKLADEYAETYGFTVTVKETTARGYYLSIPTKSITTDLPPTFIQPVKTGKFINCTTEEVSIDQDMIFI